MKFFKKQKATIFSGMGFDQGIGFDVEVEYIKIFGIKFIIDITFNGEGEWFERLKLKLKENPEIEKHIKYK